MAVAGNRCEASHDPTAHAEVLCLREGGPAIHGNFQGTTLYVTHEPCPMCAGAILQARLPRLVYGCRQPRIGADGSWVQLLPPPPDSARAASFVPYALHAGPIVQSGVLEEGCEVLIRSFFQERRATNKKEKTAAQLEEREQIELVAKAVVEHAGSAFEEGPAARIAADLVSRRKVGRLAPETFRRLKADWARIEELAAKATYP